MPRHVQDIPLVDLLVRSETKHGVCVVSYLEDGYVVGFFHSGENYYAVVRCMLLAQRVYYGSRTARMTHRHEIVQRSSDG